MFEQKFIGGLNFRMMFLKLLKQIIGDFFVILVGKRGGGSELDQTLF